MGQTPPPLFGNARIFTAPIIAVPPLVTVCSLSIDLLKSLCFMLVIFGLQRKGLKKCLVQYLPSSHVPGGFKLAQEGIMTCNLA